MKIIVSKLVKSKLLSNKSQISITKSAFSTHNYSCGCMFCGGLQRQLYLPQPKKLINIKRDFAFSSPSGDDDDYIEDLLTNNKTWVKNNLKTDEDFYTKLAQDQTPKYLYFGCSDSRVPANEIVGLG